jgi:hypothetical protein
MKTYILLQAVIMILAAYLLSGCMQLTGAKKITLGTWEIEANSGFDVSAGVQQYDHVLDKKGYNVTQRRAE